MWCPGEGGGRGRCVTSEEVLLDRPASELADCGRPHASRGAAHVKSNKQPTTRAKPLPKHRPTATQAATRSRSLLSRSRVSRAVEAARRVGGGLIVAALCHVRTGEGGGGWGDRDCRYGSISV